MVLSDHEIRELAKAGMIHPFVDYGESQPGHISFGLTSYGYDCRLADEFRVFTNTGPTVDPKNFSSAAFVERYSIPWAVSTYNSGGFSKTVGGNVCVIPPNSFILGRTIERFKIPRDILVLCIGKSTYSRCGILVGITPLEPEWEGFVTVEVSNSTPLPVVVYAGEGIAQLVFLRASETCDRSYADKKGKYQGQVGIVLPKVG